MNETIANAIAEHARLLTIIGDTLGAVMAEAATRMIECLRQGHTIYWCGNGGSAADAQHFAAELIGRFERERRALASVALTADTSVLTSLGNDYGFHDIFRRQVEGLVRPGDVLVGISTSGGSPNVLKAIEQARAQGGITIGLLGRDGGAIGPLCDIAITVPGTNTARIQEMHAVIGHVICDLVERELAGQS
ncbi:MAG: D-sedoheptulose 7-phosphate isomerase [Chromatiales bacterium]|jgi:D-sedoheptulose 7-phosphate isomerase|nr:D-sedoheptulose 7-phosphate isomerase [Chromatiales bacterium]